MKIQHTIYDLKITNAFFKHKPIHVTTWQSPASYVNITDCKTNTPRRNPFRNQIAYTLVRNNTHTKVFDSKATISTTTNSDHKPVIAKIMIKINLNLWNKITKMLKQAPKNTIGYTNKSQKSINEDVKELSLLQRNIKIQIKSCIHEGNRTFLKIYWNRILTEIHFIIKNEEKEKIKQTTAELENMQNDNAKMYEAVKKIKHRRPLQKVLMKGKNDLTAKTRRAK